jgi:hypothetical protein
VLSLLGSCFLCRVVGELVALPLVCLAGIDQVLLPPALLKQSFLFVPFIDLEFGNLKFSLTTSYVYLVFYWCPSLGY